VPLFDGPRLALRREVEVSQEATRDGFWAGLAVPVEYWANGSGRSELCRNASGVCEVPAAVPFVTTEIASRLHLLGQRPQRRLGDIAVDYGAWLGLHELPSLPALCEGITLPSGVMHGDLLPKNILVSDDGYKNGIGIIDWELGLPRGTVVPDLLRFSVGLFQQGASRTPLAWLDKIDPYRKAEVERANWLTAGLILATISLLGWGCDRDRDPSPEIQGLWHIIEAHEGALAIKNWMSAILY
jgi:hypothetical protein